MATTTAGYPQPHNFKRPSYTSTTSASSASTTNTSSTVVQSSPPEAPWYGHEETAHICARFVCETFSSPELFSADQQRHSQNPTLAHFVAYALYRTRLHPSVTYTALRLLFRLKSRFPAAKGSSGHRLFICAFMIASKVVCDDTYSNKSWCVVGQNLYSLKEMNQMEREMCGYLDWQLNVEPEELAEFERDLRRDHGLMSSSTSRAITHIKPSVHLKPTTPPSESRWPHRPNPPPLVIPRSIPPYQHRSAVSSAASSPPSATSSSAYSPTSTPPTPASSTGSSPASSEETCLTPESESGVTVAIPIDSLCSPVDVDPYATYQSHRMISMPSMTTISKPQRSSSEPTLLPSSKSQPHRTVDNIEAKGGYAIAMPAAW